MKKQSRSRAEVQRQTNEVSEIISWLRPATHFFPINQDPSATRPRKAPIGLHKLNKRIIQTPTPKQHTSLPLPSVATRPFTGRDTAELVWVMSSSCERSRETLIRDKATPGSDTPSANADQKQGEAALNLLPLKHTKTVSRQPALRCSRKTNTHAYRYTTKSNTQPLQDAPHIVLPRDIARYVGLGTSSTTRQMSNHTYPKLTPKKDGNIGARLCGLGCRHGGGCFVLCQSRWCCCLVSNRSNGSQRWQLWDTTVAAIFFVGLCTAALPRTDFFFGILTTEY